MQIFSSITLSTVGTPPRASGTLTDATFSQNTGSQTRQTAQDFTGPGLSYALISPPPGVTIDVTNGVVTIDTAATGLLGNAAVVVEASNPYGSDTSGFSLSVFAASSGADITARFGSQTAAGSGGLAVTGTSVASASAGNASHWQIGGGFLSPSSSGAGNIVSTVLTLNTGQTVDITVFNGWSVRGNAEIAAVQGQSAAALSGRRMEVRPTGAARLSPISFGGNYPGGFTVAGADPSNRPKFEQFFAENSVNFTLEDVIIEIEETDTRFVNNTNQEGFMSRVNNSTNFTCQRVLFDGLVPESSATFLRWTRSRLTAMQARNVTNFSVLDCEFARLIRAINGCYGDDIFVRRNYMHHCWGDLINIGPKIGGLSSQNATNYNITDNIWTQFVGDYRSGDHPDFIQIFDESNSGGSGAIIGMNVERNYYGPGSKGMEVVNGWQRQYFGQGIFIQTAQDGSPWTGGIRNFVCRANVFVCDSSWGIGVGNNTIVLTDALIEANTFVPPQGALKNQGEYPCIRVNMSGGYIRQNIVCGSFEPLRDRQSAGTGAINSATLTQDNVWIQGSSGWAQSAAQFQAVFRDANGTGYFVADEFDDAMQLYLMKPNGTADADSSGSYSRGDGGALGVDLADGPWNVPARATNTAKIG